MTKLRSALSILMFAVLLTGCKTHLDGISIYRTATMNESQIEVRISLLDRTIATNDISEPIVVSQDPSCVTSSFLTFAVSPEDLRAGSSWSCNDIVFEATGEDTLQISGQPLSAIRIEAVINDQDSTFYFTEERGLIGFGPLDGGAPKFVSLTKCGLFSESRCVGDE